MLKVRHKVRHVMTATPVTVGPKALIDDVLELMLRHSVSGVPVVDSQQRLLGIISEYDVLSLYNKTRDSYDPCEQCDRYMTTQLITISDHASLEAAIDLLLTESVRRLLVVSGETLVGVLSRRDVARCIRDERLVRARTVQRFLARR